MAWTDEDRRRVSEQNARVQRARDQAFQTQQRADRAHQVQQQTQRTQAHEKRMKQLREQGARAWANSSPGLFSRPAKIERNTGNVLTRGGESRENPQRGQSFWLLCGFAIATYFLYQWQLPRTGLVGVPGAVLSFAGLVVGAGVLYALRGLIAFVIKWTFILALIGGVIYLYAHRG